MKVKNWLYENEPAQAHSPEPYWHPGGALLAIRLPWYPPVHVNPDLSGYIRSL